MSRQGTRFWTFNSLVGAFLDLSIAYFLLCGSTIAFFAGKFLGFFGLSLPSPSHGFFGIPNSDLNSLLLDYPTDKISAVQFSVTRKFPFDSIFFSVPNCNASDGLNLGRGERVKELEGEASSSSISDARKAVKNETDDAGVKIEKERGFDMKGKGALNHRVRGSFRRRKKSSLDSGKRSSVSSSPNWITCVDQQSNEKEHVAGVQENSILSGDNSCNNYEAQTPMALNDSQERIPINDEDKANTILLLTRELIEEQDARAALYIELEKERSAAATAADEAMAMILRLQEEKASIEMESRQYQRMIEEKSAYDEEEMNILKEIVLRREMEKHFLEKEVEAYRQTPPESNQSYNNTLVSGDNDPDRILRDLSMSIDLSKQKLKIDKQLSEKTIAIVEEEHKKETDVFYETNGKEEEAEVSGGGVVKEAEVSGVMGLPPMGSKWKSLRRNSTSALDNERTKLDTEVEWLRERLRIVQEGREKLNFSIDNREKESLQLQLLEDIARQLQEIRMLTEPRSGRQASLPLPSAKVLTVF
ncbi:unnamed protein product [Lactuca virosa]|uniref:GTD-binding domain-containing protein n=1 Tax=Lactuca virosa TaxID=75947 RepID=A0AAU9NFF0_9ASTR|nr:unnamed protein product [Lactuca virosa]